ncbi:MAG: FAD-dependent oxidoreductase [Clostridia bacterium]
MKTWQMNEIRLEINEDEKLVKSLVANKLGLNESDFSLFYITKKAIDARKKNDIHYKINVIFSVKHGKYFNESLATIKKEECELKIEKINVSFRPIIVGSGPSGLFCALVLSRAGLKPIIIEQGKNANERKKDVEAFWAGKKLDLNSNVQFGQGGAGTFSDGKLNSGINSPFSSFVLSEFAKFGAPEEIKYAHAPHVGTDILLNVLINMQKEIEENGGEFLFEHTFSDFEIVNNKIVSIYATHKNEIKKFETNTVFLCIGHSSRETFELLYKKNIEIVQKPFSIGLRIEHLQSTINTSQYGEKAKILPPADYKLSCHLPSGRSVYSFCMCPGGFVVNASSEEQGICCNGMSYSLRDGTNANSAILVNVDPVDFGSSHPLAGIYFQKQWEQKAYSLTASHALPVQKLGDFKKNQTTKQWGKITPQTKGQTSFANLNNCLPPFATQAILEALPIFDNKIHGFNDPDSVLTGVETRSSCPLRIVRDENHQSLVKGIFPCGEGAGYSGGIMSSSVDGIKTALYVIKLISQGEI